MQVAFQAGDTVEDILQVSTDMVEPDDRTEYWREVTSPLFEALPCESGLYPRLEGSYGTKMIGSLMGGYSKFGQQRFVRNWKTISRSGLEDFYLLQLLIGGVATVDCEGRALSIASGDVYLLDLGHTFSSQCSAGATYSLLLHRSCLEKIICGKKLHGVLFKAGQPQTQLLADIITGIINLPSGENGPAALAIEEAVISLLALALQYNSTCPFTGEPALIPVLRSRVVDFVDAHLNEHSLDIKMIMSRFRVSRAHLYRMFDVEGGIARMIRERRLSAAYQALIKEPGVTASQLADRLGFTGAEQFQRGFRDRFGMTLADVKKERARLIVKTGRLSDMYEYLADYNLLRNEK